MEAAWAPAHNEPRCGHIPGNVWGRAYNTGIFAVRNRPAGKRTLQAWRDLLLDPQHTTKVRCERVMGAELGVRRVDGRCVGELWSGKACGKADQDVLVVAGGREVCPWTALPGINTLTLPDFLPLAQTEDGVSYGVTDQLALNMVLEEGTEWILLASPEDPWVTLNHNGDVRVHPLPVLQFPSGHAAFVQRLPWRCACIWVRVWGKEQGPCWSWAWRDAEAIRVAEKEVLPCCSSMPLLQARPAALRRPRHLPALRHGLQQQWKA